VVIYTHSVVISQRTLSYKECSVWGNSELSQECMTCMKSLCGQSSLLNETVTQMLDVMGFF
jgi:hypothetical protein